MNDSELSRPILLNCNQILFPSHRYFTILNISTAQMTKWMGYPKDEYPSTGLGNVRYSGYYNKTDDSIYLLSHHGCMGPDSLFRIKFKQKKWDKLWAGLFHKLARDYPYSSKLISIYVRNKQCFIVAPKFRVPERNTWTDQYLWSLNLYKCDIDDTSKHDHDVDDNEDTTSHPFVIQKSIENIADLVGTYSYYETHCNTVVTTKHDRIKKNKLIIIKQGMNEAVIAEVPLSTDGEVIDLLQNKPYAKEALILRPDNTFVDAVHVRGDILLLFRDSKFNGDTLIDIVNLSPKFTPPTIKRSTIKSYKISMYWAFLLGNIDREKLIVDGWIRKYNVLITMKIPDYLISIVCKYYSLDTIIIIHADKACYFSIISVDEILNQEVSENNEITKYQATMNF